MLSTLNTAVSAVHPASRILATLMLLFSAASPCSAQWAATYAGVDGADAEFIQQTSDGGYIALAESNFIAGAQDFWVFKLDSGGTVEWQKLYGGPAEEDAQPIQQTSDGGYIVAGQTKSFGDPNGDLWVIKLSPSGALDWQRAYGGAGEDEANDIKQTDDDGDGAADDGFIVAGVTNSFGAGGDIWLLKLDAAGNVLWQKTYGGALADEPFAIRQTSDGGYIVAGITNSFGPGDQDVWLLKLKPDDAAGGPGQIEWQKTYGGDDSETALSVQQTDDDGDGLANDGYVVAGFVDNGVGAVRLWVIKITADGSTITWQTLYGDGPRDFATSIQQTDDDGDGFADDGYIVAGVTGIPGDFWILKLLPDGDVDWQKTYGGVNTERRAETIEMTLDGGFITAGTTQSFGTGNDVLVLKLRHDGSIDPSCDFLVGDTDEPLEESAASAEDTEVTGIDTYVTPQATSAEVLDTDVENGFVCRATEDCANGTDDDLDGAVDCADLDCRGEPACAAPAPAATPWGLIAMLVVVTLSGLWGMRRRFG